jgi:hypothetical protein
MAFKAEVVKAVMVTAELTGSNLSEAAATAMVEHLSTYETPLVLAALARCQIELRGGLTLGAVIDRLDDGHPGPESAWAMVGELDEDQTVVWTDEIAGAWQVSRGLRSDDVARRMAFLEDYRKRLARARLARARPIWWASLGQDASQRAAALEEGVRLGRLPAPMVRRMLPPADVPPEDIATEGRAQAQAIVAQLTKRMIADKRLPAQEGKE